MEKILKKMQEVEKLARKRNLSYFKNLEYCVFSDGTGLFKDKYFGHILNDAIGEEIYDEESAIKFLNKVIRLCLQGTEK